MQRTAVAGMSGKGSRFQALSEEETPASASPRKNAGVSKVTGVPRTSVVATAPLVIGAEESATVQDTIKRKEGLVYVPIAQMAETVVFMTQKPLEEEEPAQTKAMKVQKATTGQRVS
ncbi:unnamed protein product [Linum trigynum]